MSTNLQTSRQLRMRLSLLDAGLPESSGFVAPNLYAGRYFLAAGDHERAARCLDAARRQCRTQPELESLNRDYLPTVSPPPALTQRAAADERGMRTK